MFYKEDKKGQILQEGINEAGAFSSWIASGTSYSNHGIQTVPFYIYYSMFGFQRVGDLAWAAGDNRTRGFLLGGTAGRTTLNGEGLQHEDGHSHVLSSTIPNCVSYDPTYGYEVAVIVREGLRRMVAEQEDVFYYLTLMNENYPHPAMPEGAEEGILRGIHRIAGSGDGRGPAARLGHDPARGRGGGEAAGRRLRDRGGRLQRHELHRAGARRDGGRALVAAASGRGRARGVRHRRPLRRSRRRRDRLHPRVRGADPPARARRLLGARHRRLRPQRLAALPARVLRGRPPLRRPGGACARSRRRRRPRRSPSTRSRPIRRRLGGGEGGRRSPTSGTSTTFPSSRCWCPRATRSPRRTRSSRSSPTRPRWTCPRRSPASCRTSRSPSATRSRRARCCSRSRPAPARTAPRPRPTRRPGPRPPRSPRRRARSTPPRRPRRSPPRRTRRSRRRAPAAEGVRAGRRAGAPVRQPGRAPARAREGRSTSRRWRAPGRKGRITKEDVESSRFPGAPARGGGRRRAQPGERTASASSSRPHQEDLGPEPGQELDDDPARHPVRRGGHHRARGVPQGRQRRPERDVKVTMVALLVKAVRDVAEDLPGGQRSLDGDSHLMLKHYWNIGFAADTPQGLVVPVIKDVDRKGILEIAGELTRALRRRRARASSRRATCRTRRSRSRRWAGSAARSSRRSSTRREVAILGVVALGDEAGVGRQAFAAAADPAAVALLRPPRRRRRAGRALHDAPRRRPRRHAAGCLL